MGIKDLALECGDLSPLSILNTTTFCEIQVVKNVCAGHVESGEKSALQRDFNLSATWTLRYYAEEMTRVKNQNKLLLTVPLLRRAF